MLDLKGDGKERGSPGNLEVIALEVAVNID